MAGSSASARETDELLYPEGKAVYGNPLSEADERSKLQLAVDAARTIWR
jgi:hypothetical protein